MDAQWFRDLAAIMGVLANLAMVLIFVIILLLYLKLRPVLSSIRATAERIDAVSSYVQEEISGPLAQIAALIQGVYQAIKVIRQFLQRKETAKTGEKAD